MAAVLAILVANPCQIAWDVMCVYLQAVKVEKDNAKQKCLLLSYQSFIALLFFCILFYAIHLSIIVVDTGDSFLVFVTFAITWLID